MSSNKDNYIILNGSTKIKINKFKKKCNKEFKINKITFTQSYSRI